MINWLVLLDLENLLMNVHLGSRGEFLFTDRLGRAIEQLKKRGRIILGFAFTPRHLIPTYEKFFDEKGFFVVSCPRIRTGREEKDTTDDNLIAVGKILINNIPDFTHLCLGSGDRHFMSLLKSAREKELKITAVVGNVNSLSEEVSAVLGTIPGTDKRDVIVLTEKI